MTTTGHSFYKTGGTLAPDEPSYVARRADEELHRRLSDGQFCYVLTSRQMGKSSLMNKVSTRLHREGVAVADVDLTTIGQNLTVEQWYDGLIYEIGRSLNVKSQLRASWQANVEMGPLQRFVNTLRDALLTIFFQSIVIFVDEIEVVSGLPFRTDEFFAAIRECYNRRASHPELNRLTFCLLGMATPHELVQDPRITPFNIGHRIDLMDFSEDEAMPLAAGMCEGGRDGTKLLRRVLYWTHGQPYLTQRLCQAVAEDTGAIGEAGVDRLCRELFLSERARESEPNLVPLREYVLRSAPDRAALLDVYQKVLSRKRVLNDANDDNVSILQLAGITRAERGYLRPKNPIYARVFDRRWIRTNMPDAELRRQRAAFWRAFAVNASVFGSITLVAIALAALAYIEQKRTSASLYVADMKIADQALDAHHVQEVELMIRVHRGDPMAGFEYGYLWRQIHRDYLTIPSGEKVMSGVAFSPDSRLLAAASVDGRIVITDIASKAPVRRLRQVKNTPFAAVRFDPSGKYFAAITNHSVTIWNTADWSVAHEVDAGDIVTDIDYDRTGARLAMATMQGIRLIDCSTWKASTLLAGGSSDRTVRFSPVIDELASAGLDGTVRIFDAKTAQLKRNLAGHAGAIRALAYSADGANLASSGEDYQIIVWDTKTWLRHPTISAGDEALFALAYVPDGLLAAGGSHSAVELWNTETQLIDDTYEGHTQQIRALASSPDGRWLASASWDTSAKIWDLKNSRQTPFPRLQRNVDKYSLSGNAKYLAGLVSGDKIGFWNTATGEQYGKVLNVLNAHEFAMDGPGQEIAVAVDRHVSIIDTRTGSVRWHFDVNPSWFGINSIAIARDGSTVAVGGVRSEVEVWSYPGKLEQKFMSRPYLNITGLAFSEDGGRLAVGDQLGNIAIYSTNGRNHAMSLVGEHAYVRAFAFSHDGRELASTGADHTIKVWNLDTAREVLSINTGEFRGLTIDFVGGDMRLVAVGYDGSMRSWDSESAADVSTALSKLGN